MESSSKNMHTKQKQFEVFVDFMCAHPDLAKGHIKMADAKQTSNQLWKRLASDLNAEGPPMRDAAGWKKVWADHKTYIKSKLRKNKTNISGTGGGPSKLYSITSLEEQVITLLNFDEAVSGLSSTRAFGVLNEQQTAINEQEAADLQPDENISLCENLSNTPRRTADDVPVYSRFRSASRNRETNLRQKQVENQIEYQKNSYRMLQKINGNLETLVEYKKKSLELKEKQYELKKDIHEYQKQNDIKRNKIKLNKLELKQEMLRLQSNKI